MEYWTLAGAYPNTKSTVQLVHCDQKGHRPSQQRYLAGAGECLGEECGPIAVVHRHPDGGGAVAWQHGHCSGVTLHRAVNLIAGHVGGTRGLGESEIGESVACCAW